MEKSINQVHNSHSTCNNHLASGIVSAGVLTVSSTSTIEGEKGETGTTGLAGAQGTARSGIIYYNSSYNYPQSISLDTSGIKNICNVTFTAPGNGTVHLLTTVSGLCTGDNSGNTFGLGNTTMQYNYASFSGPHKTYVGTTSSLHCSSMIQGTYQVTAGTNYTFYVLAHA